MGGGTMPNLKDVGAMSKAVGWGTHLSFGQNPRPAERIEYEEKEGRYPAQTFIDSQVAEKLDLQSGVSKSSVGSFEAKKYDDNNTANFNKR